MYIQFKKLTFQNLLSYGNIPTTFTFTQGLNLLSGKNGVGKSSIPDALCYNLYGYPYRKVKIEDLINNKNKKGLYTKLEFNINKNEYTLKRGINPNILEIYKNGNKIDLLSTKKLIQSEINKILGIDKKLFRQIISLAINYNRPFLSLPLNQKREIIEQIFKINIFGEMKKEVKKRLLNINLESEISENNIRILKETLISIRKQLKCNKNIINNFENDKTKNIQTINENMKLYNSTVDTLKKSESELLESYTNIPKNIENTLSKSKEKLNNIVSDIKNIKYKLKLLNKDLKFLDENDICNVCKNKITKKHKEKEIKNIKHEIENLNNKLKEKETEKTKLELKIKHEEGICKSKTQVEEKLSEVKNKIKNTNKNIEFEKEKLKNEKEKKLDLSVSEIEKNLNDKSEEYKKEYKKQKELIKNRNNYDIIDNILSESGIKSYFFDKLLPILNKNINGYLNKFDLPININFNQYMEEKIINFGNSIGKEISYDSLSEGEKKRIDVSVLLAFIDISKLISNWNCNLLIMDEILDSSIDDNGLEKLISSIKQIQSENKNCIYIISHRSVESDTFNNTYNITKDNGFSKIEKIV